MAHALSRSGLGPRQGARHALQHRRRHPHGARDRRHARAATGRAATPSAGTGTRPSSATSPSATSFQKHSYPLRHHGQRHRPRFVDEGADFRNYTYAKYGRVILEQPQPVRLADLRPEGHALLRDEYRIRQVTKVTRRHHRGAGARSSTASTATPSSPTIADYNAAVRTDIPFNPNVKDGRCTDGPRRRRNRTGPTRIDAAALRGLRRHLRHHLHLRRLAHRHRAAEVIDPDGEPIPGLYAAGELVGGLFYFNYPGGSGLMSGAVFGRHRRASRPARAAKG